ncbi:hypothetical protein NDN08_003010 [Rhodosorus marinus]|uniref:phosphoenolpyruvate carboxykinase (GTP) n=1 Tax=Rhodosorus marinus TaxID=101924 RepID=A0AAV8UZK6_9RHOD|nr:hypothetical protein NDN08_003010 [Rhodosorus marinus]
MDSAYSKYTSNRKILTWVGKVAKLCRPKNVVFVDGSRDEHDRLCEELVQSGTFIRLNEEKRPNSYLARSDPRDVARVEKATYICTSKREDAGETNNWEDPAVMKEKLDGLLAGCMAGRTMYVIPFCMGPVKSPFARFGVQITDSPYAVVHSYIMTRIGQKVLNAIGKRQDFLPCIHSVGYPLEDGRPDVPWPCDPDNKYICHFPEDPSVLSYGSGYGGNALLGKKCFALRIASYMGKQEGWLAEHCLIIGCKSPSGVKKYFAAAFPSACGKTNLAMLRPSLPGWEVTCVGDDIAWLRVGPDGRMYGVNPEAGFFGVAPGTSMTTNYSAMQAISQDTIFTNVALTPDGDVWWEGMTNEKPEELIDWRGEKWNPNSDTPAAHPNSRYTCPAQNCPIIDEDWEAPDGVPISGILFGGRRKTVIPLVQEARSWRQGVFMGSCCASERTAAAEGKVGELRIDPFAMIPFCGYNMADYFSHWLEMGHRMGPHAPKIFFVNWFRKGSNNQFLWPGFSENIRVLKWIMARTEDDVAVEDSPYGYLPNPTDIDMDGLDLDQDTVNTLLSVDADGLEHDIQQFGAFYKRLGDRLPETLMEEMSLLKQRLLKYI